MGINDFTEEMFSSAVKKHQEELESENQRGSSFQRDFEEVAFSALQPNRLKFVRVIGVPMEHRAAHDPLYSPKLVYISWMVDDKGKKMRTVWPNRTENRDWPLYKIMDKVLAYDFDKETNSKLYHHSKRYPKLFNRVFKNLKVKDMDIKENGELTDECRESLNPYETGWKPSQYVVMNVIDRAHYDWHKENKHTMVLSKKATPRTRPDGTQYFIYEPGVPKMVYDLLMSDEMAGAYGFFKKYDVIIKKLGGDPWYKMYHPEEDKKFMSSFDSKDAFMKEYPFYDPEVHLRDITEEELSWESYNFEKIYKITSYQKILNRLGDFIKQYDKNFNDSLYDEVKYLAEKEKKSYKEEEQKDNNEEKSEHTEPNKESSPKVMEDNPIPVKERQSKERGKVEEKFDVEALQEKDFKGIAKLSDEEKDMIIGYDEEKGTFIYNTDGDLYACINAKNEKDPCPMVTPESFSVCPRCGAEF